MRLHTPYIIGAKPTAYAMGRHPLFIFRQDRTSHGNRAGSRSTVSRRLMSLRWQARIRACAGSCVPRIAIAIRGRAFPDVFGSDIENKFLSRVCIRTFQVASLGIGRTDVIRIGVANRRKRRACLRCRRSSRVSRQWPGYGLSRRWCPLMSAVSCCSRPFGTQNCRGHTRTRIPSAFPR
jgi:hypothetical protein